jgi:hypothetical protein
MTLLYKSTKDGDSASTFHSKCDYQGNTLSLIRNTKCFRCGGFTTQSWSSSGSYINDVNAFIRLRSGKEKMVLETEREVGRKDYVNWINDKQQEFSFLYDG